MPDCENCKAGPKDLRTDTCRDCIEYHESLEEVE
jgi:hypothetical protein